MRRGRSSAKRGDVPVGPRLRVAQVWRDEVMADEVLALPAPVTLGESKSSTFTIPSFGLPPDFAILTPDSDAYMLTLRRGMTGQVRVAGQETEVAELIDSKAAGGELCSVRVQDGDWGVIELDGKGEHNLFFQFVKEEPPLPPAPAWRDTELLVPAFAFALILHTVLLAMTFHLRPEDNRLMFPGKRSLMTSYLIQRPVTPPPPEPAPAEAEAASADGEKENVRSATRGEAGKAGGESEKPRARDPEPSEVEPAIETGLLTRESRETIRKVTANRALDDRLQRSLARLQGNTRAGDPGSGPGTGVGFGPGTAGTGTTRGGKAGGPGGGGSVQGDFVSQGRVDTGETRAPKGTGGKGRAPREVVVKQGKASGDFGGLSKEEIDRVIRSRAGLIRACYQRELNRTRNLGGTLVLNFRIQPNGQVQSVRVVPGRSTLRNPSVESCVVRQISNLKFPAKGGGVVNYPFIFGAQS